MSHSTTATSVHTLTKYSKCYTQPVQSDGGGIDGASDWQHFVNPVLRLVLDIKKAVGTHELESVRVRIVWLMDTGCDVQNEVILEDLDLLAFSAVLPGHHRLGPQSLPLKAVYKDAVVGVRYLHPRVPVPNVNSAFRRFQVVFASCASASEFIHSIQHVCPCKENPTNPHMIAIRQGMQSIAASSRTSLQMSSRQSLMPAPLSHLSSTSRASVTQPSPLQLPGALVRTPDLQACNTPLQASLTSHEALSLAPTSDTTKHLLTGSPMPGWPVPPPKSISGSEPATDRGGQGLDLSSSPRLLPGALNRELSSSSPLPIDTAATQPVYSATAPWPNSQAQTTTSTSQAMVVDAPSSMNLAVLPGSTPPSSSGNSDRNGPMLPPPINSVRLDGQVSSDPSYTPAFLTSIRDAARLYDLETPELEALVAKVVCEPGFISLMQKLDVMWRVKALLN